MLELAKFVLIGIPLLLLAMVWALVALVWNICLGWLVWMPFDAPFLPGK